MSVCMAGRFSDHPIKAMVLEGIFTSLPEFWKPYRGPSLLLNFFKLIQPGRSKQVLPIHQIRQIHQLEKILFIHSQLDTDSPVNMVERLQNQANIPTDRWILPEGIHTKAIEENPAAYEQRVVKFFETYLS